MIIGCPPQITSEIRAFCKQIVGDTPPVYLKVEPEQESIILECYPNVYNYIRRNGGSVQYGWRIGQWANVMLEAEFHAVWRSPDGSYKDITPFPENRILFLPDSTRLYEGKQIDNIRFALSNDPRVRKLNDLSERIFEETNRGELAEKHGEIRLPANVIGPLLQRRRELFIEIYRSNASSNSVCFCGSGRKYKKCHKYL